MRPDVLSDDALDVRNFMLVNFMLVKLFQIHNESALSFQSGSNSLFTIAIANENSVPRRTYFVRRKSDEFLMSERHSNSKKLFKFNVRIKNCR